MTEPEEPQAWGLSDDLWSGVTDEYGTPFDIEIEPAAEVAAEAVAAGEGIDRVRLAHLPDEFWGARDLFKQVWLAAKADGTAPDAVLGATLAKAAAMLSHRLTFHSVRPGSMQMFVSVVAPSGIGKTEAIRTANRLILPPTYLTYPDGTVRLDLYKDAGLGSGEGIAEAYMGMKDVDTGEFYRAGPNKGDPRTKSVRCQTRHNAFLFLDEGEALTKMMSERKGATVGMALRTAWVGGTLGQSNAQEITTRHVPEGTYSLGMLIGYQPRAAQAMFADVGGGTPQRFLWLSALDPEMAEAPGVAPEPFRLPLCDGHGHAVEGVVQFPEAIRTALWGALRAKNRGELVVDELDSHEPLMRCKLAALLCVLDNRLMVSGEDWHLAGLIWQVSCAVRDRLIEFGRQEEAARRQREDERHVELTSLTEAAKIEVNERVAAYGRRIAQTVSDQHPEPVGRSDARRNMAKSTLRKSWDAGLEYAIARGWVKLTDGESKVVAGEFRVPPSGGVDGVDRSTP
jgi:hypothetical protein